MAWLLLFFRTLLKLPMGYFCALGDYKNGKRNE